jgi:hypothetical protein
MANFHSESQRKKPSQEIDSINADIKIYQKEQLEQYRAFMTGYVKRINESSFNVPIGGIRIGLAKYTRLAQINLNNRVITFSRYAIENVPERGRRYLVLHELAHVKEASHNKRFWELVARYEPDYKQIGKSLEKAFKQNVKGDQRASQNAFSFHDDKLSNLSSEPVLSNSILSTGTEFAYENELLSLLAEEKEKYQSLKTSYNDESEHFIDWLC